MKKEVLKHYLGMALSSVMLVVSLSACGNIGGNNSSVTSSADDDKKQTEDAGRNEDGSKTENDSKTDDGKSDESNSKESDKTDDNGEEKNDDQTQSVTDDANTDSNENGEYYSESIALYEGFLAGNETMTINKVDFNQYVWGDYEPELKSDSEYTFDEFFKAFFADISAYNDGDYAADPVAYTYVDCGQDGTPELVLNFTSYEYNDEENNLMFIKDVNGKLELCKCVSEGVRGLCYVNNAGVIYDGGSGGADDWYDSYYGIDENGDAYLIYESETDSCYLYSEDTDFGQIATDLCVTDIFIKRYSFDKYDGDYSDGSYEQFLRNCYYTFERLTDSGDAEVYAELYTDDSNYVKFISQYTDNWYTPDEMDLIINERLASFGITYPELGEDDPTWTVIEGHDDIYSISQG